MTTWEAVIGLETHVELQTDSKMFCGCPVAFGDEPNTSICPVCLGLPGALPVPNEEAIEGILSVGAALDCTLTESSLFYRKNYFYPDLPKNFQISQYTFPLCVDGHLDVDVDGESVHIGITRVHMEEDTGKSLHIGGGGRIQEAEHTLLDFNRAGVPLVEIVTEPDIRSADQARAYGAELQRLVRSLGVSDARLEEGSMRFDANVSIRPAGSTELGTRTEVKNVNSLRSLQRAVLFEIERQIGVVEAGDTVHLETRHWNEDTGVTKGMRSKEESEDYRYFQEPDLLPLHIDLAWQERVRDSLPELPSRLRERLLAEGVDPTATEVMVASPELAEVHGRAVAAGADPRSSALWITGEVVAYLRRQEVAIGDTGLTGERVAQLAAMVADGALSATAAKEVMAGVLAGEGDPKDVAEARDLLQISDEGALQEAIASVLLENEDALEKLRTGDMKPLGFLVGQVMKATGGKADPKIVQEILRREASG